jgi:CrcB protein
MTKQLILVGCGGCIGSILRYVILICINKDYLNSFPVASFIINVTGCLLAGLLIGLTERCCAFDKNMQCVFIIGLCGGYTTFSAMSFENFLLFESGHYLLMTLYSLGSIIAGFVAMFCGLFLSKI